MLVFCTATQGWARLEFDSYANKVQIHGPYVKYNLLNEPYSLGRFQFELDDVRLEVQNKEEGKIQVVVIWPRFLLNFGRVRLIGQKERVLLKESFDEENIGEDEKFARYPLEDGDASLLEDLKEEFQVCLSHEYEESTVKICSDKVKYNGTTFEKTFTDKNAASSKINGRKSPKNAQVSLAESQSEISLDLKFKSGFSISIKDMVRRINKRNVVIDPKEKRVGIVDGRGSVRPTQLTLKDRFFSFIKENNYYRNQYQGSKNWPENLEDAEMEFAPYQIGGSIQLYGIIMSKVPPPFEFKLNDNAPIATYARNIELRGTKAEGEVLAARQKNELFINNDQKSFLWNFPTPKKGEINQNYISLQHKGEDYYFSQRVFRAHQTAVSASAALTVSDTLDIVPGYSFAAEHWFEELWNKSRWSFQRWGIKANIYETINGFKVQDDPSQKYSVNPIDVDILFRLKPGVRPVQSSFGVGLRYLNLTMFRSIETDISAQLLGIGGFWHTAPQKIIDDIFNIIPFFRYPKWMELYFYYYPVGLGTQIEGPSFSWQAKGKMFFSTHWFLEASFNVNYVDFLRKSDVRLTGFERRKLGTAHGTIGLGYLF